MRVTGSSPFSGTSSIFSITSMPATTRPKTVYLPSSDGVRASTMKNELLALAVSSPSLAIDMSTAVLSTAYLQFGTDKDYVFCVESEFIMGERDERMRGFFLLLPDTASLQAILKAVRVG